MAYSGFPLDLIAALRCPNDLGSLVLMGNEKNSHAWQGSLSCMICDTTYQVQDGIVHLLNGQGKLDTLLEKEIEERDNQASVYDAHLSERYEKEVSTTLRVVGDIGNKIVIEYGAGTGRLTELCAPQSRLYLAIDFSLSSLAVLAKKTVPDTLGLVLADAIGIRTTPSFFDTALSFQFIEHIPTSGSRRDFYGHVQETLKPGGSFICSLYHQDLRRIIKRQDQEGFHSNGIFYHYFFLSEFKSEFKKYFSVVDVFPIDITLPFEKRFHFSPRMDGILSRILERVPLVNRFGHLLIAKGYNGS